MALAYKELPGQGIEPESPQRPRRPKLRLIHSQELSRSNAQTQPIVDHGEPKPYPNYEDYFVKPTRLEAVREELRYRKQLISEKFRQRRPINVETTLYEPVNRFVRGQQEMGDARAFEVITGDDADWIESRRKMTRGEAAPLFPAPSGSVLSGFAEFALNQQRLESRSFFEKLKSKVHKKESQPTVFGETYTSPAPLVDTSETWDAKLRRSAQFYLGELRRGDPDSRALPKYRGETSSEYFPHGDYLSTDPQQIIAQASS